MISSIAQLVYSSAHRRPGCTAIIEARRGGGKITYSELDRSIRSGAVYLAKKGVAPGDRVGLISKNSADFICVYFAVSAAGAIPVPINYALDKDSIVSQARSCAFKGLFYGTGFEDMAKYVSDKVKSIRFIFNEMPHLSLGSVPAARKSKDPATIIFTSGSTGAPLGVMLSHRNIISNAASIVSYSSLKSSDRVVCVLPLYYIYGLSLVFSHFFAGGSVIIDNSFAYPNVVLENIERFKATGFAGVSSHYSILLRHSDIKRRKLASLRYFMQAGDAMPPVLTKELLRAFPGKKLFIMYGQTEASPRLTYLDPKSAADKPSSVGKAVPGVTVKVIDRSGKERPAGLEGELIVRGDNVMMGYWRNKKEAAKVLKKGWLYTGDIALKDKDGDIFITGRTKGFIKIGAHKVNLADVEAAAFKCSGVETAAAVGFSDDILGRRVALFVSPLPGAKINLSNIKDRCVSSLPSFGRFIDVHEISSFPKNGFGKIDKKNLEELL